MSENLILAACSLGALAAGGVEAWLVRQDHPQRNLYAWLMWTPVAVLFFAAAIGSSGMRGIALWALALLLGAIAYPVARVMARLHVLTHYSARREDGKDLERMRYRPTDFGTRPSGDPQND